MIKTPALVCNKKQLLKNIGSMQDRCNLHQIKLGPMIKTHKCLKLAQIQMEHGATGLLVATLREAEIAYKAGCRDIAFAYPMVSEQVFPILQALSEKACLTFTVDSVEQVEKLSQCFKGMKPVKVLIKIDSGLHRLGILPEDTFRLMSVARAVLSCNALELEGVSTHAGQVYACAHRDEVATIASIEQSAVIQAAQHIQSIAPLNTIAVGSTPTVLMADSFEGITEARPGNYVYFDRIQVGLGIADFSQCALKVVGTVLSRPSPDRAIIDLGSKQLGLDQGAHGKGLIEGYGRIVEYPHAILYALSEELGRLKITEEDDIKEGDQLHIIPNHACVVSNLFDKVHVLDEKGNIKETWDIERGG